MRPAGKEIGSFGTPARAMKATFEVAGKPVGGNAPCLVIAEAGVAHFGDIGLARELVELAAEAGADVFKTQFFDVETLFAERAADWRKRLRTRNLTLDEAIEIKELCDAKGLLFMSTAHDETRVPWLVELDVRGLQRRNYDHETLALMRDLPHRSNQSNDRNKPSSPSPK